MTTLTLDNVSVSTKANVYFDGKCVSHSLVLADGRKCSVGVIMPGTLSFGTAAAEIMECSSGACEYRLAGTEEWVRSAAGEQFSVPANSKFDIRVTGEPYSYICHYA
ncbi:pyrimidine/purine nucleoside phosphorylase [Xenophilus arseniciresistens]|uniref:Pyrimidine/purine nucleoside phosphorylase n=1 Tax=Xenophilus arseniciresistens TaxID=1283306 RepID=A0AAE3N810_9BURK|nr:pyrimidine/purine nucleoside phosphorylase [Xenophilus arseniciresistens]MDA7416583.1 pyrimidine/purine nucleoside phosphorylase [Xenophilus arseniciresistens]